MFIPGFIIALVTFPGVIVHELAHLLFCRLARVAVLDVCYFRLGNPSGYVIHEVPKSVGMQVLIAIGPFIVNTLVGGIISMTAAIPALQFSSGVWYDYLLIWLGISITMHAFPSTGDARSLWSSVWRRGGPPILTRLLVTPLVGLMFIGAFGSFIWLDLLYGIAVAMWVPKLLVGWLA